jgi:SAM-dependent methyltransferase
MEETARILAAYKKRDLGSQKQFFVYEDMAHLFRTYERYRATLVVLKAGGYYPLSDQKILDVGCGDGNLLRQFLQWGAEPENLAGIELRPEPVDYARSLNPQLNFRCGSADELPWPDASFNLVCLHTVFTSILDLNLKLRIASEIYRVLKPAGAILWYDFIYNNPRNPDVRGIGRREIGDLFPTLEINLQKITLAPPIARRIPEKLLPVLYPLLAMIPWLRTHYLGLLIKRNTEGAKVSMNKNTVGE